MSSTDPRIRSIAVRTLIGTACTVAVGLIRYGTDVLDLHHHHIAFVFLGLYGSLFFYTSVHAGLRQGFAALLFLFIVNAGLVTGSLLTPRVFAELLFFGMFMAGVHVFRRYVYRRMFHPLVDPIILGSLTSLGTILGSLVWIYTHGGASDADLVRVVSANLAEFFIGFGIGLGIYVTGREDVRKALTLRSA